MQRPASLQLFLVIALTASQSESTVAAMFRRLKQLLVDESGPTAVEYAVMLALIAAAVVVSVNTMSQATADSFDNSAAQIASAMGS